MKKIIIALSAILAALCCVTAVSCSDEKDTWEKYTEWRELNTQWLTELQTKTNPDGSPYYKTIVPSYAPGTYVLMHKFGDPEENADKLTPLYTSTVDVRYKLHLCDGTPVDSSSTLTVNGPGIFRSSGELRNENTQNINKKGPRPAYFCSMDLQPPNCPFFIS